MSICLDDKCRVVLKTVGEQHGSDYINASYVYVSYRETEKRIYSDLIYRLFIFAYY